MSRKHHYKAKCKEPPEMDITTFLNLMVVLIPFLLISAVFSRITIMELDVPSGAGGTADKPKVTIEVILRENKIQVGNGKGVVASFPNKENKYDIESLSAYLMKIKKNYPEKTDATILLEPEIKYTYMVLVMDAVRSAELTAENAGDVAVPEGQPVKKIELFPDMSIGEAS